MILNILLWIIIAIFVGLVGYKIELNKGKHLWSNILAAFIGVFVVGFTTNFLIWPDTESLINPVAAIAGLIAGFIMVKLEDTIWLRV